MLIQEEKKWFKMMITVIKAYNCTDAPTNMNLKADELPLQQKQKLNDT
jgi:hypothetical protein